MATALTLTPTPTASPVLRPLLLLLLLAVVVGAARSSTGCVTGTDPSPTIGCVTGAEVWPSGEGVTPSSVPVVSSMGSPGGGIDEAAGDGVMGGSTHATAPCLGADGEFLVKLESWESGGWVLIRSDGDLLRFLTGPRLLMDIYRSAHVRPSTPTDMTATYVPWTYVQAHARGHVRLGHFGGNPRPFNSAGMLFSTHPARPTRP